MPIDESKPISEISKNKKETGLKEGEAQIDNIDEDISENIEIHTMPKRFKISTDATESGKTKAVGAVIMVVGVLVLATLIYLSYIYLINPKPKEEKIVPQKKVSEEEKEETTPEKKEEKKTETPSKEEQPKEDMIIPEEKEIIPTEEETKEEIIYLDTDGDILSDIEEEIFGTSNILADTDSDGYDDLSEINNGYDPIGSGLLASNPNISKFENSQFGYEVLYPASFLKNVVIDGSSVIFGANDNSFVQIISQANGNNEEIDVWFKSQFPESEVGEGDVITKDSFNGIFHKDKKIFYLTDNNKKYIFIISYVPEPVGNMSYYNIFKMVIDSFSVKN